MSEKAASMMISAVLRKQDLEASHHVVISRMRCGLWAAAWVDTTGVWHASADESLSDLAGKLENIIFYGLPTAPVPVTRAIRRT